MFCAPTTPSLPETTWECEKNMSALKRLISYMTRTILQTCLKGLALLHNRYCMENEIEEIIHRLGKYN